MILRLFARKHRHAWSTWADAKVTVQAHGVLGVVTDYYDIDGQERTCHSCGIREQRLVTAK